MLGICGGPQVPTVKHDYGCSMAVDSRISVCVGSQRFSAFSSRFFCICVSNVPSDGLFLKYWSTVDFACVRKRLVDAPKVAALQRMSVKMLPVMNLPPSHYDRISI